MKDAARTPDEREVLRRATLEIRELRARVEELERSRRVPVAVIGLDCRFPGARDGGEGAAGTTLASQGECRRWEGGGGSSPPSDNGPDAFWRLLADGVDAVREVPRERWGARWGGSVEGADLFDASFFGISPREAAQMDPQQRLLLETAWTALERAGQPAGNLAGSRTGVFIGINTADYGELLRSRGKIDAYASTGNVASAAPGRISYVLGLCGPSVAVDTACSSSLAAIHLACQSLTAGECRMAVAGGVNLVLAPEGTIGLSALHMLSPDGRCKTFDASADGFVRGEGCGVAILKRLPDALADRDPVLALVLGSAMNQDGKSSGFTVPSGLAQQALIGEALAAAGLSPREVGYVEAHGTGTSLGDPIEIRALRLALCQDRPDGEPLLVGSVKTNVGHLEAAAGIAGFAKAVLALVHEEVPPHLHLRELHPDIALDIRGIRIPTERLPWPRGERRRVAGVSSFGFSGTNVHVVLAEAPPSESRSTQADRPLVLPLSAKTPEALRELAGFYARFLAENPGVPFADVCFTAAAGRAHFERRLAVVARSGEEARERLARFLAGGLESGERSTRYEEGGELDLAALFAGLSPRKIELPTYPFQRRRHWFEETEAAAGVTAASRDWAYEVEWRPEPRFGKGLAADFLDPPATVSRRAGGAVAELASRHGLARYEELALELDRLAGGFTAHAIRELGLSLVSGEIVRDAGLAERLGVAGRHRLLARLLSILAEDGVLVRKGGEWEVVRTPDPARIEGRCANLLERFPEWGTEIRLLGECGEKLAAVLRGEIDPLSILFPGGSVANVERLYRESPVLSVLGEIAAEAVAQAAGRLPPGRGLSVLEIGAGTGATTARILPRLPSGRTRYVFTDVSPVFVESAREKFRDDPFVRYELLDIERDPASQGFEPGSFDLILAADVLHATKDLAASLARARTLLAPGGLLVLVEGTAPQRPVDLTFGLTEGWWRFEDPDLRPAYPLLSETRWLRLLEETGLAGAAAVPTGPGLEASLSRHSVLLARAPVETVATGDWLILSGGGDEASRLAERLRGRGERARVLPPAEDPETSLGDPRGPLWRGVVDLRPLDAGLPGDSALAATRRATGDALSLVQALVRRGGTPPPRLWLVTRGVQRADGTEVELPLSQSPVWGLGAVAAIEHPELRTARVDLDPAGGAVSLDSLAGELLADEREDRVALRGDRRLVARLARRGGPPPGTVNFREDRTYLLAGGLGGLGLLVAGWLVEKGARHLVLVGRSEPDGDTTAKLREIEKRGARVLPLPADVSRVAELQAALDRASDSMPPLAGVFHLAGVLDDGVLLSQTWDRFAAVMAPKVEGAWNLHRLTAGAPLDHFALFSSVAGLLGSPGQGNHAAANAFLDALAHHRRSLGLPGVAIDWGGWAEVGAAARRGAGEGVRRRGVDAIPVEEGLAALEEALASGSAQTAVVPIRWPEFVAAFPAGEVPPFFAELAGGPRREEVAPVARVETLADRLRDAAPASRREIVAQHVREEVSRVLGLSPAEPLDPGRPLSELGLDSLMALELRNALAASVGRELPATLSFDYPTVDALADYLCRNVLSILPGSPHARAEQPAERPAREPIAVIGMGLRFPGGANDPASFWRLLAEGRDAVREIPPGRWDVEAHYHPEPGTPGKMYARRGGFLDGVDLFDPHFFGIAPKEAASMDPQHRLLLETSWEALEHAGIAPDSLAGSATGVFVGISTSDYIHLGAFARDLSRIDPYLPTGNTASAAPGRISYVLGLQGPSLAVDTACSSSLVAVHLACASLASGECRMALAGGANLILSPTSMVALSALRMLSPDGRSKTFDASADGFARGEGCGIVVLKRLSDALADGDRIHALVLGTAVNQDGRSNGLTAPNGPAQEAVIARALAAAGARPAEVGYVEAHGTGTSLGDPIEVGALAAVFSPGRTRERPLAVGSVKTNLGHLECAAGIAGLAKTILALEHGEVPPSLHFETPNPHIEWERIPVAVATRLAPWPLPGERRIAGVSSFGFSGTNAHVVLSSPPPPTPRFETPEQPLHLLALSAKDPEALRELARRFERHLADHPEENLADVAFTAGAGRAHFHHRLAVVVESAAEARERLAAFAGRGGAPGVFLGRIDPGTRIEVDPAALALAEGRRAFLETLASLYVRGARVDWAALDRDRPQRKLALPTYPFQRERYWIEEPRQESKAPWMNWLYRVDWKSKPLVDRAPLARLGPREIARGLEDEWRRRADSPDLEPCGELARLLESLSPLFAHAALRRLGWEPRPEGAISVEGLARELGVVDAHRRLFGRMLEMLEDDGLAFATRAPDAERAWNEAREMFPASAELELLGTCGRALPDVLAGKRSGIDVLFPGGSAETVERLYRDGAVPRAANELVAMAVRAAVERAGENRKARILEIGAGTGATTSAILSALPPGRTEYVFTDVSGAFLAPARGKFAGDDSMRFELLDVDRDSEPQGFLARSFDVVVAANVLHATADLARTIGNACRLLVPGGLLVVLEATRRQRWADLTMGLTEGWWKFRDETLRASHPVLDRERWLSLLGECGLEDPSSLPSRDDGENVLASQSLFLARAPRAGGAWVLLCDRGGTGERLASALVARGERALAIGPGEKRAGGETIAGAPGVVDLRGLDSKVPPLDACTDLLEVAQDLARTGPPPRLWVVTRCAVAASAQAPADPEAAALWGLASVAASEHPELGAARIDLDRQGGEDDLVAELLHPDGEDRIAWRDGRRLVARLVPWEPRGSSGRFRARPDATYLVTGGLGGLGLAVARRLVERGARHLVLVGRRGASSEAKAVLDGLARTGARVVPFAADVSCREDVERLFSAALAAMPPLAGVVHSAGVIDDAPILSQSRERLARALAPKVEGTRHLAELAGSSRLDFFVLFSSAASLFGSPGQANHAAANAFLDSCAPRLRSLGLPATSVSWGAWGEIGAATGPRATANIRRRGMDLMSPALALDALEAILVDVPAHVAVAAPDRAELGRLYPRGKEPPLLQEILAGVPLSPAVPAAPPFSERPSELLERLRGALPPERRPLLFAFIRDQAARVLGLAPSRPLSPDQPLGDLGLDSLMALDLRNALAEAVGTALPATLLFDRPTVRALADYLGRDVLGLQDAPGGAKPDRESRGATLEIAREVDSLSKDEVEAELEGEIAATLRMLGESP